MISTPLKLLVLNLLIGSIVLAESRPTLVVGVSAALSGPIAEFGTAVRNGIELFVEQQPEKARKVKFIFEDDRYEGKLAVAAFNKFKNIDKTDLVFSVGIAPSEAVAPLAERNDVPLLANSINPSVAIGRRQVIRFINHSAQYSGVLLNHFRKLGYLRFASVKTTSSYCDDLVQSFSRQLTPAETLTEVGEHSFDDMDFRSVIAKLRAGQFEAAYVCLFPGQVATFFRQAQDLGLSMPLGGTDAFESSTEISNAKGAMDGAIYPFNLVTPNFETQYRARFGNVNHLATAANGHDMALLISSLADQLEKTPTSQELLELLKNSSEIEGALGKFRYKEDATGGAFFDFEVVLKRVSGGNIEVVKVN